MAWCIESLKLPAPAAARCAFYLYCLSGRLMNDADWMAPSLAGACSQNSSANGTRRSCACAKKSHQPMPYAENKKITVATSTEDLYECRQEIRVSEWWNITGVNFLNICSRLLVFSERLCLLWRWHNGFCSQLDCCQVIKHPFIYLFITIYRHHTGSCLLSLFVAFL